MAATKKMKLRCMISAEFGEFVRVDGETIQIGSDGSLMATPAQAEALLQNQNKWCKWNAAEAAAAKIRSATLPPAMPILTDPRTGRELTIPETQAVMDEMAAKAAAAEAAGVTPAQPEPEKTPAQADAEIASASADVVSAATGAPKTVAEAAPEGAPSGDQEAPDAAAGPEATPDADGAPADAPEPQEAGGEGEGEDEWPEVSMETSAPKMIETLEELDDNGFKVPWKKSWGKEKLLEAITAAYKLIPEA